MSRIASDEIKVRFNKRHKVSPHTSTVYELTKCLACTTRVVHGVVKDSSVVFVKLSGRSLSHDFFKAESPNLISLYPGERNLFLGLQVNRKKSIITCLSPSLVSGSCVGYFFMNI